MLRLLTMTAGYALLAACSGGSGVATFSARPVVPEGYGTADAGSPYQSGKRQLEAGNVGLAIDAFRKAIRSEPGSLDALNGLAVAYDRIGRFDLSRRYYEQALGIEPDSATILHNLGYSLTLQGKVQEGRELMARAASSGDPVVRPKAQQNLAAIGGAQARSVPTVVEQATGQALRQWVERTTATVQTLVTTADPIKVSEADVDPRLRRVHAAADIPAPVRPPAAAFPSTARAVAEMAAMDVDMQLADTSKPREFSPVVVVNAVGRGRMATRLGGYLTEHGVVVVGLGNGRGEGRRHSVIRYAPASRSAAIAVAKLLPFSVGLEPTRSPAAAVQVILGRNALGFDDKLIQRQREA
jgi:hypothetical protein